MNKQSARLVLKTSSLSVDTTDYFGYANASLSKYRFNDINLRTLLGNMFNEYDLFNLSLKSIVSSIVTDISGTPDLNQLCININISGLPFINQTYDAMNINSIKCMTNKTTLTTIKLTRNQCEAYYFNDNYLTFSKNQELCHLSFEYETIDTQTLPSITDQFPDLVYIFEIYPVGEPKSINQIMNQRIV